MRMMEPKNYHGNSPLLNGAQFDMPSQVKNYPMETSESLKSICIFHKSLSRKISFNLLFISVGAWRIHKS